MCGCNVCASIHPRVVVRLGLKELWTNLPTRLLFPTPMSCYTNATSFPHAYTIAVDDPTNALASPNLPPTSRLSLLSRSSSPLSFWTFSREVVATPQNRGKARRRVKAGQRVYTQKRRRGPIKTGTHTRTYTHPVPGPRTSTVLIEPRLVFWC